MFKTQTLMKMVDRFSRTAEEDIVHNKTSYYLSFTKLSVAIVVREKELSCSGKDPETADDRRF